MGNENLGGIRRLSAVQHREYTVATVPNVVNLKTGLIYVSNGATNSPCMAFSDGTTWLRCDTLAAIST